MIDNQAIAAMSEMLVLIKKYAKNAYPDVETASSNEHRRRAWVITSMLARLAEHMANSDLEAVLSDNVHNTYSERQKYAHAMKQSDRAFMLELHEFKKKAEEYKKRPIKGLNRTDGDIVRCLENLRPLREALCARRADFAGRLGIKLSKKEAKEQAAHLASVDNMLQDVEEKLAAAETAAASRGIAVSLSRYRTVIEKVRKPAKKRSSCTKASPSTKSIENLLVI